ncbi:MAG: hypothetical protein JSW50_00190, partial [Candidatus Latescibacterota bacterium]
MHLIVRDIDFARHAITIEVGESTSLSHQDHIAQYIRYCSEIGLSDIKICYPKNLPTLSFVMLKELQKNQTDSKRARCEPDLPKTGSHCRFECVSKPRADVQNLEYEFRCTDLCDILDHLTAVTLLIGNSIPLDDESLSYLRLGTYELGTNSVEHGDFSQADAEARLNVVVSTDHLQVTYWDNAREFCTI